MQKRRVGAQALENRACQFTVWAPLVKHVEVRIVAPGERLVPMERDEFGYWKTTVQNAPAGTRYFYRLDSERDRPDPASHFQPEGVHGPSQVVDHRSFPWDDGTWKGIPLPSLVMYELHPGAFTPEGTFDAIVPRLDDLASLGITAIELMPVSQCPGSRNWGYDGVYPYAVQDSYGGPEAMKRLVNACHGRGIAVILDVVYNHLGPEGNYLWDFAPYFTETYRTPWGPAINFDGPYSDEVRQFIIANALHWITDYHVDALRLDAVHGIFDFGARHILQDLGEAVHLQAEALGRSVYVIPESDLNDVRLINPVEIGGFGLDAQWNDDFHHALHTLITGEHKGYYEDFGRIEHLERSVREGFVYAGDYSVHRKRRHGNSAKDRPGHQFVVFSQNHDQVGNRMQGERLAKLASFEALKLAAGAVILSPNIPLLFMGEEYGEESPFLYFVSHGDQDLIEAVRKGRNEEFRAFSWDGEPPDPQDERTFEASKIDWSRRGQGRHAVLLRFYQELLRLRRELAALAELDRSRLAVSSIPASRVLAVTRWDRLQENGVYCLFNFEQNDIAAAAAPAEGRWKKLLDSADASWNGPGSQLPAVARSGGHLTLRAESVALYVREDEE